MGDRLGEQHQTGAEWESARWFDEAEAEPADGRSSSSCSRLLWLAVEPVCFMAV